MGRLAGKVAIVSGGATGCGAAAVRLFAAEGATVGIIDRNAAAGQALADELGPGVMFAAADVSRKTEVDAAVAAAANAFESWRQTPVPRVARRVEGARRLARRVANRPDEDAAALERQGGRAPAICCIAAIRAGARPLR